MMFKQLIKTIMGSLALCAIPIGILAGGFYYDNHMRDQYTKPCYWATSDLPHCIDREYFRTAQGFDYMNLTP